MAVMQEVFSRGAAVDVATLMVGQSRAFQDVLSRIDQVAPTDATVLLLGETGTGKGLAARLIHERSRRSRHRFVHIDCGSLPPTLIESELFGHERGAFTGAVGTQIGRFELASCGTVFMDEIGEVPLELQAKLLRALQFGEFERLGSTRTVSADVRVVAATNRRLAEDVGKGAFRRDLYYRLNVFPITMPTLRSRPEDIRALANYFLAQLAARYDKHFGPIPHDVMESLQSYDWPGNVRELENVLERAVIISAPGRLRLSESLEALYDVAAGGPGPLADVERAHILQVLDQSRWRIEGLSGAARALGLRPSTLRSRMQRLGIARSN